MTSNRIKNDKVFVEQVFEAFRHAMQGHMQQQSVVARVAYAWHLSVVILRLFPRATARFIYSARLLIIGSTAKFPLRVNI